MWSSIKTLMERTIRGISHEEAVLEGNGKGGSGESKCMFQLFQIYITLWNSQSTRAHKNHHHIIVSWKEWILDSIFSYQKLFSSSWLVRYQTCITSNQFLLPAHELCFDSISSLSYRKCIRIYGRNPDFKPHLFQWKLSWKPPFMLDHSVEWMIINLHFYCLLS